MTASSLQQKKSSNYNASDSDYDEDDSEDEEEDDYDPVKEKERFDSMKRWVDESPGVQDIVNVFVSQGLIPPMDSVGDDNIKGYCAQLYALLMLAEQHAIDGQPVSRSSAIELCNNISELQRKKKL